jgi:hypothetical protein
MHRVISSAAASGDANMLRVADGLKLWLDGGDAVRLEDTLGIGRNWRSSRCLQQRNKIYGQIAVAFFPGLAGRGLCRGIETMVERYRASLWKYDRARGVRPYGKNALAYDLLSLGAPPLGAESLRRLGIFSDLYQAPENLTPGGFPNSRKRDSIHLVVDSGGGRYKSRAQSVPLNRL